MTRRTGTGEPVVHDRELDALLARRDVHPVFQPVVDLATAEQVGVEALARGPRGSLHAPDALFEAARTGGRLTELDRLCRDRALEVALATGLPGGSLLFVNVEPAGLPWVPPSPDALATLRDRGVTLVVEFTERALIASPARLIAFADQLHRSGCALALDDVGADPASLALMPFVRPELVKLDMRLVQGRPDVGVAEVMTAVTAYAEQDGAVVLAEGIETTGHELVARSLGAGLGQGWRFGHPLPLGEPGGAVSGGVVLPSRDPATAAGGAGAFDVVADRRCPRTATKAVLTAVSDLLEQQAAELRGVGVVLAAVQTASSFTDRVSTRYAELAKTNALVLALGTGMPSEPAPGVRGVALQEDDAVCDEWDVVVVGPHFSAALVARDQRLDDVAEADRGFDYVLTYDRALVLDAARALLGRAVDPVPRP